MDVNSLFSSADDKPLINLRNRMLLIHDNIYILSDILICFSTITYNVQHTILRYKEPPLCVQSNKEGDSGNADNHSEIPI